MPVIDAQGLSRRYGAHVVLDGVSLTIEDGERVGLVGANGSGKSTLARILAAVEEPDAGQVVSRRGLRVAYLGQEPRFEGEPTMREAVLTGLGPWSVAFERHEEASRRIGAGEDLSRWLEVQANAASELERLGGFDRAHDAEAMLARLGLEDPERPVSAASGGERRRVDLARVLVSRPELAILDEPTNHLDLETLEWLEEHLGREQPGAILVITHDRAFLDRVVTRTAEMERGTLHVYEGGWQAYLEAKAEREAHEARAEHRRQRFVARELEWLRSGTPARTTKQKARIGRAEAAIGARPARTKRDIALNVATVRSGSEVLTLEGLGLERGGKHLLSGLDLAMVPGERLGVIGPNGCGKSTFLRTVLGELPPSEGVCRLGANVRPIYLDQRREGLDEAATVLENVAGSRSRVEIGGREMDTRAYLERFLFSPEQQRQPVGVLSGGEKARALLAKLLLVPTNLLVLDEPTNDLDVMTLSALETLLVDLQATVIVVTHDRYFLDRIATSILAFEGGRATQYPGGYSDYRALRRQPAAPSKDAGEAGAEPKAKAKAGEREKKSKRGLTYGERLELEGILEKIDEAEARVKKEEAALADPNLYAEGGEDAATRVAAHEDAQRALESLITRWESLEEKKAEGEA